MKYLRFSAFVAFFVILSSISIFAFFKDNPKGLSLDLSDLLQSKSTNNHLKSYTVFWEERFRVLLPGTLMLKTRVKGG